MENIRYIDSSVTNKVTINTETNESAVNFILKLQNQSCIESLLNTFDECIRSIWPITGIRYRYPLLGITHKLGEDNSAQCHLYLKANEQFLGDITIYNDTSISNDVIKNIELISSLLTHPLRAIIQEKSNLLLAGNEETIGIANASLVEQLVTREAKLANRERAPLSLILLDIDRFKRISGQHGFITRDEILYQTMQVLRSNIRDTDLLFRYENDTYCLILKGVTEQNALLVSERIRQAVDDYVFKFNYTKTSHLTISCGIAKLDSNDSIDSIFSRATNAMHHAKKLGRNQSIVADGTFIS